MKPKLLSHVLRQSSPRKMSGNKAVPPNRYNVLSRDSSPADSIRSDNSYRPRSQSLKRKPESDASSISGISFANIVTGPQLLVPETAKIDEGITKVRSICSNLSEVIGKSEIDPVLIPIFGLINEAMLGICDNQYNIVHGGCWKPAINTGNAQVSQTTKKARAEASGSETNFVDLAQLKNREIPLVSVESHVDPKVEKFKEAVRDAEKATLIFNLNLGNVPIMNQDTMSTKASAALGEMAAKIENSTGKIPSQDTLIAIDDVLSVATGIQFYGRKTKSFSKKNDPQSGLFCTIPVRYNFNSKEERIEAETLLRDKCKINCTTPYPTVLRECIRQVLDQTKRDYPGCYIRVIVDTGNMSLRILRRALVDPGQSKTGPKVWTQVGSVPIPAEALDIAARTVPEHFKVSGIPTKDDAAPALSEDMITDPDSDKTLSPGSANKSKSTPSRAKKNLAF
jgi:hypothetical protein